VEYYQIVAPLENKGGEAERYTKVVHFSELIEFRASTLLFFLKKGGFQD
jgi:hypothetical protein